ncbi:MAG: hypothetical protein EKK42_09430 [Pseudonocardiaceae bacterium]|nr:MAG: hypothetical protein EKK42_09430 [Pseudonocardiaceae bacterium]
MIDTGHPKDWRAIRTKLEALLNGRTLDFIIPTHPEYPHAGNIGSLAAQYPESTVVGDVRDYHLYYPDLASRLVSVDSGQPLDLGSDAILSIVPGVIRDLSNTIWVHDSVGRVLYVSDGFGYSHRHGSGECVCLSSEMYSAPGRGEAVFVLERAMPWSRLVRNAEAVQAVHDLMLRHPADTVAPAHGNVIDNPVDLLPTLSAAMVEFGVR